MAIVTYTKRPDMAANGTELVYKNAFLRTLRAGIYFPQDRMTWLGPIRFHQDGVATEVLFRRRFPMHDIGVSCENAGAPIVFPKLPIRKVIRIQAVDTAADYVNGRVDGIAYDGNPFPFYGAELPAEFVINERNMEDLAANLQPRSLISPNRNTLSGDDSPVWRVNNGNLDIICPVPGIPTNLIRNYGGTDYFTARMDFFSYGQREHVEGGGETTFYVDWIEDSYPDLVEIGTAIQILVTTGRERAARDLAGTYQTLHRAFTVDNFMNQIPA